MRTSFLWPIPFICALLGYTIMRIIIMPQTIKAPLLTGMHLENACVLLSEHNISLQVIQYKIDPDTPDNIIISQTPAAHQTMRPSQTMFLTLSQKPKTQTAPHCYQKHKDIINSICSSLNIKVHYYPLKAPSCKYTCFAQYPAADSPIKDNSMTIYTTLDHADPILWPNFVSKPLQEVIEFLESYDITPQITYSYNNYNNNHVNAFVIDQRPLAGSLIEFKEEKKPIVQLKINT